ncbi:hypothetical protein [Halorubrum sp. 2020YC2]|uniref:hypothetical protein n=1 Tax=Halorubrum sp. 2020YC2 TaxID=2836432 RepID=UPI001BE5EBC6|nr:hypothetical protein [Halorubrum sp. 2020YC2]QWC20702.1 hypothetical protein KI388_07205 [Halorubrum sp. 2020YC2]
MSVPHPGGDPNANLYAQLKRDVLDRVPQVSTVEFVPDDIEATQLRAIFDPARLDPPTGLKSPELTVKWYRQDPDDWFRVNYTDSNTGFHAGWHQDEDHPDLGQAHFQYSTTTTEDRWGITFEHETPSLILWEIVEELLKDVRPTYQYANDES